MNPEGKRLDSTGGKHVNPGQVLSNCVLPFPRALGTGRSEYFKHCPVSESLRTSERGDFAHALREQNVSEHLNLCSVPEGMW